MHGTNIKLINSNLYMALAIYGLQQFLIPIPSLYSLQVYSATVSPDYTYALVMAPYARDRLAAETST